MISLGSWIRSELIITQNISFLQIMEEVVISGGKRTRTADILLAKQALYQLSYTPNINRDMGHPGLEPGTSPLSGVRSNHLS